MQASEDRAVKVLNGLIETTLDSANGYREAADHAANPQFKTMFSERAQRRMELTRRLQDEVRSFGGKPEDDQSMMGKLHNKFVALRDALSGGREDKAVIDEVERGEDFIRDKYKAATTETDLPERVRIVVQEAYVAVKADHDEISRMKHSMH